MKIEYILVLKEEENLDRINIRKRVQNALKKCFDNVKKNNFEIVYKNKIHVIDYNYVAHKTSDDKGRAIYYLTFSYGTSKNELIASVLDMVNYHFSENINKGESKFHVTISYDELSMYFASRAYPYFIEFESKLRSLTLKLLTQIFGALWAKETLTEEQVAAIKENMHGGAYEKIASEALYEMDISTLEKYLFEETRKISAEDVIDNYLKTENLQKLEKTEIEEIIAAARPKSNWERFFAQKVKLDHLQETLSGIRKKRNKVAHIKHYYKNDFIEDKQVLKSFNIKIGEAINSIEVDDISAIDGLYILEDFASSLKGSLTSAGSMLAFEATKGIVDLYRSKISEMFLPALATESLGLTTQLLSKNITRQFNSGIADQIHLSAQKASEMLVEQLGGSFTNQLISQTALAQMTDQWNQGIVEQMRMPSQIMAQELADKMKNSIADQMQLPFSGMAEQMRLLQQSYTNSITGMINATAWDAHETLLSQIRTQNMSSVKTLCARYKSDRLSQMSVNDVPSFRELLLNGKKKYKKIVGSKFS